MHRFGSSSTNRAATHLLIVKSGDSIGSHRSIPQPTEHKVLFAMPHHRYLYAGATTPFGRGFGAARRASGEPAGRQGPLLTQ